MATIHESTIIERRATNQRLLTATGAPLERTIRVKQLEHYFGEGDLRKQALFDNTLDIHQGEIVIMTGPSGSGKTTLLTLIGTLRSVQEGSLRVLDRELLGASPSDLVETRRNIGFIFQAHNLFGSLTAMQNVKMGMELFDFSQREMKERGTELLTRLGLEHRIHYKPDSLSGGQKQRVAIARGLAHGPKIVLADEPTAALDEQSGREVVTLFQELARDRGVTILMVTHDNRILDVADRMVSMVDGHIKSNVLVKEAALICAFLQELPAFEGLMPSTLASIADKMLAEHHTDGDTVIRQNEEADKFYLIHAVEVDVRTVQDGKERHLATLKEGQYFGEMALMSGERRNATVTAKGDLLLYTLTADDFRAAVDASASFKEELQKVLFERQ